MKQNIFVVSYNYALSKRIAAKLAESFSMRVFDQRELFDFDNTPNTLPGVYSIYGREYVLKQFKGILKEELEFSDSVFVSDISFADNCFDLFYKIKLNNFVVFLFKDIDEELVELGKIKYKSLAEKDFYKCDKSLLESRERLIKTDCADISVDITGLSDDEISSKVVDMMQKFYEN